MDHPAWCQREVCTFDSADEDRAHMSEPWVDADNRVVVNLVQFPETQPALLVTTSDLQTAVVPANLVLGFSLAVQYLATQLEGGLAVDVLATPHKVPTVIRGSQSFRSFTYQPPRQ